MVQTVSIIINLVLLQFNSINCLQFIFGDCPLYYEEPCSSEVIKFILNTKTQNLTLNPFKLNLPDDFNPKIPIKILIHGYGGLSIDSAIKKIQQTYQNLGYNIILVDWSQLAEVPCYTTAFLNTWHVGQCIAILAVSFLPFGVNPDLLHLIGFSLGAHIAGFTGTNLKKTLQILPGRITGLDPALPFFATLNNEWKLDSSDAKFVDVIHTSAGSFGKIEALGHADFYVNGGFLQPDCYDAPRPPICSHVMSGYYFADSIENPNRFIGFQCDNIASYLLGFCTQDIIAVMGEHISKQTRGQYFVTTTKSNLLLLSYIQDNFIK